MPQREKGGAVNRGEFAHNFFFFLSPSPSVEGRQLKFENADWHRFPLRTGGKRRKKEMRLTRCVLLEEISLVGPRFSFQVQY